MVIEGKLIELTQQVAYEAGKGVRKILGKKQKINFENSRDVKLQADVDTERKIRKLLSRETDFPIIGEEEGGANASVLERDEFFWVVDPIDGTYNFLREHPGSCVSIGLMRGSDFVVGAIYDFTLDEMFLGVPGEGVFINGKPIKPKWEESLHKACLMTGFTAKRDYSPAAMEDYIQKMRNFKKIRMIGSAALSLAYVGVGRADAYFEEGINLWDIAAGAAIVLAAGGFIKMQPVKDKQDFVYNFRAVCNEDWLII